VPAFADWAAGELRHWAGVSARARAALADTQDPGLAFAEADRLYGQLADARPRLPGDIHGAAADALDRAEHCGPRAQTRPPLPRPARRTAPLGRRM
jgi:hypothetical protein